MWGNKESVSGGGSTIEATKTIRTFLKQVCNQLNIKRIVDAPCGDFNWMRYTNLRNIEYIGIDIVEALIAENQLQYNDDTTTFICADISVCCIPKADLIICRDCLAHLSFQTIFSIIKNFKHSDSTYLLATTYPTTQNNISCADGTGYPYNLCLPPFNFPKPLMLVEEFSDTEGQGNHKSCGLWLLCDLPIK